MSFATYATFKTALVDWAWSEITTSQATDMFTKMQAKLYRGHGDGRDGLVRIEPLRIRAMVSSGTLTPSATGEVTISTGVDSAWLDFVSITPTSTGYKPLDYVEPWEFKRRTDLYVAGVPSIYTIEGDTLYTAPYGTGTLAAIWYEKFTALSADGDTDWMLTNAPHVYLDGCLMEVCDYLQDEREGKYRAAFAAGIAGLNISNAIAKSSGAPKRAMPRSLV